MILWLILGGGCWTNIRGKILFRIIWISLRKRRKMRLKRQRNKTVSLLDKQWREITSNIIQDGTKPDRDTEMI